MKLQQRTDEIVLPVTTKRLVVLGDPHGDLAGLDGVLAREDAAGVVLVSVGDNVGYGDGPTSSEFCRRLRERGIASVSGNHEAWMQDDGTLAIITDRSAPRRLDAEALAWCGQLPLRLRITAEAAPELRIAVVHTILDPGERQRWDYVKGANADIVADAEGAHVVFVGHSHGPAIYTIPANGSVRTERLDLDGDEPLLLRLAPRTRYVVDAGSLARPGYHPDPGRFERATYAALDLATRALRLCSFTK